MDKAVFYKSNGEILCECELESNIEIVFKRKTEFERYLNERRAKRTHSKKLHLSNFPIF